MNMYTLFVMYKYACLVFASNNVYFAVVSISGEHSAKITLKLLLLPWNEVK